MGDNEYLKSKGVLMVQLHSIQQRHYTDVTICIIYVVQLKNTLKVSLLPRSSLWLTVCLIVIYFQDGNSSFLAWMKTEIGWTTISIHLWFKIQDKIWSRLNMVMATTFQCATCTYIKFTFCELLHSHACTWPMHVPVYVPLAHKLCNAIACVR